MSPRRRLFVIFAVSVVVLGLFAAALAGHPGSPSRPAAVPQDHPGPVLLVPGYGGAASSLGLLAARLRRAGREVSLVALPDGGTGDLRAQARSLGAAATAALRASGARSVDVVGFSAGGVVARLWVRSYGGAGLARRVVTLGSPHHGTDLATLAGQVVPDSCPTACRQLAPGSDLLQALNTGDETPAGPRWVTVWSTEDVVVTPTRSATLAGAVDVGLQTVCPDDRAGHGELPRDPLAVGIVVRALGVRLPTAPSPADCAALRALGGGRPGTKLPASPAE